MVSDATQQFGLTAGKEQEIFQYLAYGSQYYLKLFDILFFSRIAALFTKHGCSSSLIRIKKIILLRVKDKSIKVYYCHCRIDKNHCDNVLTFKNSYELQVSLQNIRSAADQYLCLFYYCLLSLPFQARLDDFMLSISPVTADTFLPPTLLVTPLSNFMATSRVYYLVVVSLVSSVHGLSNSGINWCCTQSSYSGHLNRNTEQ